MFKELDLTLQQDLIDFCEKEKVKLFPKPLKSSLVEEILRQICNNEREITGILTDYKSGDIFVRFSFIKNEEN